MTRAVPVYLSAHIRDLEELERRVAHERWLAATGQPAPDQIRAQRTPQPVADGTLIREALEHADHAYAATLAQIYFRTTLAEATAVLRRAQREHAADADKPAGRAALREHRLRWLEAHAAARARLGFATHGQLVRALHPDVDQWVGDARRWLDQTRDRFLEQWAGWQRLDGLAAVKPTDTRLVADRAGQVADPVGVAQRTVRLWGLGRLLDAVTVDREPRPGKLSFAFCSAVDPPCDVRISIGPGRGLRETATVLHEFGHALHFTAAVTRPADLWGVPTALLEAVGLALELVVREPAWQRSVLDGGELARDAVGRIVFGREAVHRLVAAGLCFEMSVHDESGDAGREYERVFSREFAVPADPADAHTRLQAYLEGQQCYPLVYHQAFAMRDAVWARLGELGGPAWFAGPRAGDALRELFAEVAASELGEWHPPGAVDTAQEGRFRPGRRGGTIEA